ncbi:MAG TPA: hypothetical protein VKE51_25825 [Vicinamibacterales bacterium]|nr:hypothetical protein [Vicinamibacterales bacterium]
MWSLALGAAPARAQTTFTNRTAWETAAGPNVTIRFEGIAPAGGLQSFPAGLTLSGVTFIGSDAPFSSGRFLGVVDGATLGVSAWASGAMLTAASLGTSIASIVVATPGSVSLPPGVTAVGFNYGTTCAGIHGGCGEAPWSVRLSTGQVVTIPPSSPPPNMAFWGVVSNTSIASIQINPTATFLLVDNFSYAPAVTVPALPNWTFVVLTMLLVLMAMASIRRRSAIKTRHAFEKSGD